MNRTILVAVALMAVLGLATACGSSVAPTPTPDLRYAKMVECNMKIADLLRTMQEGPELSAEGMSGLLDQAGLVGNWIAGGAEDDAKPFDAIIEDLEDGEC